MGCMGYMLFLGSSRWHLTGTIVGGCVIYVARLSGYNRPYILYTTHRFIWTVRYIYTHDYNMWYLIQKSIQKFWLDHWREFKSEINWAYDQIGLGYCKLQKRASHWWFLYEMTSCFHFWLNMMYCLIASCNMFLLLIKWLYSTNAYVKMGNNIKFWSE